MSRTLRYDEERTGNEHDNVIDQDEGIEHGDDDE
jgi:hypothetical protein